MNNTVKVFIYSFFPDLTEHSPVSLGLLLWRLLKLLFAATFLPQVREFTCTYIISSSSRVSGDFLLLLFLLFARRQTISSYDCDDNEVIFMATSRAILNRVFGDKNVCVDKTAQI